MHTALRPGAPPSAAPVFTAPGVRHGELRAALTDHAGERFANLCVWRQGSDGVMYPSRNALTVAPSELPSVRRAIDALEATTAAGVVGSATLPATGAFSL
jgi:hypothetical protein